MSKAPDKIYLAVGDSINYIFPRFYGEPKKHPLYRDVEYIRKDALLEWIHTELDAIEGKEEMSQMELAFTEVIDKIQRM